MAAKDLFLEELDKEAWNCIVGNLAKVVEEGELCRLSADALATIIASDQITCEEEQVHLLQINSHEIVVRRFSSPRCGSLFSLGPQSQEMDLRGRRWPSLLPRT